MTYEFVSEGGTRLAGLKSDEYDLITNLAAAGRRAGAAAAPTVQGQEHPILILDADEGITADVNVRKALNLAVDKEAIAEQVFGGFASGRHGPAAVARRSSATTTSLEPYAYDPDEAKRLIEEAGVAGETITLVGESSGRWLNDRELVEAVAGYWTDGRARRRPPDAWSSAPTSTSCSTARTAPTRSSCRARTTSSTPTAS